MTPQPGTLANIESPETLTQRPSRRFADAQKLHREIQRLAHQSAVRMKPLIDEWFDLSHTAIIYGVRTQLEMGLEPIEKGIQIEKATPGKITSRLVDWGCIDAQGILRVRPLMLEYAVKGANAAVKYLRFTGSFDLSNPAINKWASTQSSKMVREITRGLRGNIRKVITETVRAGRGVNEAASAIRKLQSFNLTARQVEYVENYRRKLDLFHGDWANVRSSDGVKNVLGRVGPSDVTRLSTDELGRVHRAVYPKGAPTRKLIDQRVTRYRNMKLRQRSISIARTESINSLNQGMMESWKEAGVERYEWMASSDACPICTDLNGRVWNVGHGPVPTAHPSCRCTVVERDKGKKIGD